MKVSINTLVDYLIVSAVLNKIVVPRSSAFIMDEYVHDMTEIKVFFWCISSNPNDLDKEKHYLTLAQEACLSVGFDSTIDTNNCTVRGGYDLVLKLKNREIENG